MAAEQNPSTGKPDRDAGIDEYLTDDHIDAQGEYELLRGELTEAKDRVLRAQAELENYRRRSQREMQDTLRYAEMPLLRDLLPVLDDVQRAIQAAEKSPENSGLLEGFRMVEQKLVKALESHDCKRIPALDHAFDPNMHQAIAQQPIPDKPAGTIVLVAQDGYTLHDRVVRPAQVIVSS